MVRHGGGMRSRCSMRSAWARALVLFVVSWTAFTPSAARGAGLDVKEWLSRPGVRLVAVEFYASWCKPCMEAVPRWKALHERYRADGMRLLVVATQDPQGGCVNPGWNPDDIICDEDGTVARALGAADRLPSAFLWSWQGDLLVRGGHVDEVESAVQRWMQAAPRIDFGKVEAKGANIDDAGLRGLIRAEVDRFGKVVFVASEDERQRLMSAVAESMKARYDEKLECKAGQLVSANSLLEVRISGGPRPRLQLGLMSAERGCQLAGAVVDWFPEKASASVAEAVAELVERLRGELAMPLNASEPAAGGRVRVTRDTIDFGGKVRNERPNERGFLVVRAKTAEVTGDIGDAGRFVTATVFVDGNKPAGTTRGERGWSSSAPLVAGVHRVTVTYLDEHWSPAQREVEVRDGETTEVELELRPRFGLLEVATEPPGAHVDVEGRRATTLTPVRGLRVPTGDVTVQVTRDEYLPLRETLRVEAGKSLRLERQLEADFGSISVTSEPPGARISIDGARAGTAPAQLERQPAGRKKIELALDGYAPMGKIVEVLRGKGTDANFKLEPLFGRLIVKATLRSPDGESDCRADVTVLRRGEPVAKKKTPAEFRDLLAVAHEVEVECAGVHEKGSVTIRHNEDATLEFAVEDTEVRAARKEREQAEAIAREEGARLEREVRAQRERDDARSRTAQARIERETLGAPKYADCIARHTRSWCSNKLGDEARAGFDRMLRDCTSGGGTHDSCLEELGADEPEVTDSHAGRVVAGIALFAAAVAGGVGAAYLGVQAKSIDDELEATAATTNRDEVRTRIEDGRSKALLSDVLLGAALAAGVAGVFVIKF